MTSHSTSCSAVPSGSAQNPVNDTLSLVTPHVRSDIRSLAHAAMARARAARAACHATEVLPDVTPLLPRLPSAVLGSPGTADSVPALRGAGSWEATEVARTSLMIA